jgi:hypothetical protein
VRLSGALEQRLTESIQPSFYRIVCGAEPLVVEEMAAEGRARVEIENDAGGAAIEWKIQGNTFGFLRDTKNADGAFFVRRGEDGVEAHIVECKRTVTQQSWSKAKLQMRWTLLRLSALAGVLGVTIHRVVCYTAYCDDEIDPESSSNPAAGKVMSGEDEDVASPEDAEDIAARRRLFDWHEEQVYLREMAPRVPHKKLRLTRDAANVGVGSFRLTAL